MVIKGDSKEINGEVSLSGTKKANVLLYYWPLSPQERSDFSLLLLYLYES